MFRREAHSLMLLAIMTPVGGLVLALIGPLLMPLVAALIGK